MTQEIAHADAYAVTFAAPPSGHLELQVGLECDHARRAVPAQADA
jgi:hypothetical protein